MSDELKLVHCGCGGEAEIYTNGARQVRIYCSECEIETTVYDTEAGAIEAWNTAMGKRTAKAHIPAIALYETGINGDVLEETYGKPAKVENIELFYGERVYYQYGKCGACGEIIYDRQKYCSNCGKRLDWVNNMGLTEHHWFEDDERELTEWQLEKSIADLDKAYKKGYANGYKDGAIKSEQCTKYARWIPVSERLPETWKHVLVYCDKVMAVMTGYIGPEDDWLVYGYGEFDFVTHWCELPEPPELYQEKA